MRALSILLFTVATAGAQISPPPFVIRTLQGGISQLIGDGGTLALPAEAIGAPVEGSITVTYTGTVTTVTSTITSVTLSGSTDFSLAAQPDLTNPLTLTTASPSFGLRVRYAPTTSRQATARIVIGFGESTSTRTGNLTINLVGTAPEFGYTYQVLPNGNTTLLNSGDTIQLPATNLNETSAAQVTIINRGSGQGAVQNIAYSGPNQFVLANLPFPPATVDAGKSLTFNVRFTPTDFPAVNGAVSIQALGQTLSFKVAGAGQGAAYGYQVVQAGGVQTLPPGGMVTLPDATIGGDKTYSTIRVTNSGTLEGRVTALSVSGAGFTLVDAPFIPLTLAPGASFTFRIQFAPAQPGKNGGRLRIGNDNFDVEGTGLGANLTYSYLAGAASIPVQGSGTVVMPATSVGQTSSVIFTIKNDGTAPTDVVSISASGTATAFTLSDLPALPMRIAAGASVSFGIGFAPINVGAATATLKIDTQSFTLSGSGNPPAALPSYSFQGASGTVEAMQQPAVGLSLSETYPMALSGVLTLNFTSDSFANDPAVQFSSGGRTIAFIIPAGSKQAIFPVNAIQVRIQTGTVAGAISLTPAFVTQQGNIDVTPVNPASLSLSLAQAAPRITGVVITARSSSGFTVQVTGYATSRSVTQMDFGFTPVSGESLGTSKLSLNVEPSFLAWYQSSTSLAYGSQFSATVSFSLAGDISSKTIGSLTETLQSVSVTLTNRQGVSPAVSANLK